MKQFIKSMLSEPGGESVSLARCVSALFALVSAVIVPFIFWRIAYSTGTDLVTWVSSLGGLAAFFSVFVGTSYAINKVPSSISDILGKLMKRDGQ